MPLESYFHIDENPLSRNADEEDKVFIFARLYRNKVRAMDIITDYGSQSLQYLYDTNYVLRENKKPHILDFNVEIQLSEKSGQIGTKKVNAVELLGRFLTVRNFLKVTASTTTIINDILKIADQKVESNPPTSNNIFQNEEIRNLYLNKLRQGLFLHRTSYLNHDIVVQKRREIINYLNINLLK